MGKRRQFHCLDGVLRDLVAAIADEDGEGYQRLIDFVRIIADILEILEDDDPDLPDAADGTGGVGDDGLDLRDGADRESVLRPPEGHGAMRTPPVAGTPRMDPEVGHHAATQLALAAVPGGAGAVVRTERVVKGRARWGGP